MKVYKPTPTRFVLPQGCDRIKKRPMDVLLQKIFNKEITNVRPVITDIKYVRVRISSLRHISYNQVETQKGPFKIRKRNLSDGLDPEKVSTRK